jgi:predicted ester cyclase
MGIPPTGKQAAVAVIEIFRIENGKIADHWGGPDTMDLVQQLGGVVSAAPPK